MKATALFPRLCVKGAESALAFYRETFGAQTVACYRGPSGQIAHAELAIGGVRFYLKEVDDHDSGPDKLGGSSVLLCMYTDDVDTMFEAALRGGSEIVFPLETRRYGERAGRIRDPFGHLWVLSTVVEELSQEEIQKRLLS
jgi:PhnB protein